MTVWSGNSLPRTLDEFERLVVENADHYKATRFMGRGEYCTAKCRTYEEAKEAAKKMGGAMIYAVCGQRSVHVENIDGA